MPNWKKVIVSGSDAALNSLNVTSLLSVTGSSNLTGSLDISGSASILGNAGTTTFYTNADTLIFTGSVYLSGSIYQTGSLNVTSITSSLFGTASWAQNATNTLSASYALTASYALNGGSGGGGGVFSYHQTASAVTWSVTHNLNTYTPIVQVYDEDYNQIIPATISGSSVNAVQITFSTATTGYAVLTTGGNVTVNISGSNATLVQTTPATTWSFYHGLNETYPVFTIFDNNDDVIVPLRIHAENANTASIYFTTARTGTAVAANCGLSGSTFESASFAATASYFTGTVTSASYATFAQNASTASYVQNAQTASYVLNAVSASYAISASQAISSSYAITSSYTLNASSSQNAEDIIVYVQNNSGAQINKGSVVKISGAVGDNPQIALADWTNDSNSANTLGLVMSNIPNGGNGYVMTEGRFIGYDTSTPGWTAGQLLYLGPSGSITGSSPQAPLHGVRLGQVLRVQQINGSIYLRIDNGVELGELHDVRDTTTTASFGDLLVKSGSIWTNSNQLTGSYGLTGSLNATSITSSLFGTSSWAISASRAVTANSATQASTVGISNTTSANEFAFGMYTTGSSGFIGTSIDTTPGYSYTPSSKLFKINNLRATGSLFGTSSFADNATSASYALTSSYLNPVTNGFIVLTQVSQSLDFINDAAAAAGGVPLGGLYRNGNFIAIRIS